MTAKSWLRKLMLTAHVSSAVGSAGAVAVFLVLVVAALSAGNQDFVRAFTIAMDVAADYVIVPLVSAALVLGIIQSLITPWGLIRHYWIVFKLVLTAVTLAVLLLQTANINRMAQAAQRLMDSADIFTVQLSLALHAGGGLAVLIGIVALSVYKPRGLTPYGWRVAGEGRG